MTNFSTFHSYSQGHRGVSQVIWLTLLLCLVGCHPRVLQTPQTAVPLLPVFEDITTQTGIHYGWPSLSPRPLTILQGIGNGCAFLDYDQDGNLDILLVGSKLALYKGDGHGHFSDKTQEAGLNRLEGHFLGCAVGDYDNDGYPDVYITAYQGGVLLHNLGGKRFAEVTKQARIAPQLWGTSAVFFDYDGDGNLDLYIANYVRFGPDSRQLCDLQGVAASCPPRMYAPEKGVLYHNLGNGRFADVTQSSGASRVTGKALGVAVADCNRSGHPSLAIANDLMPGDLLQRRGGQWRNNGQEANIAYDGEGALYSGMGIDWGDYDNDGKLDLFVGTFAGQNKVVFHNDGANLFTDRSVELGLQCSVPYVTFGAKWVDVDNDGWLDLLLTNGHVQDNIAQVDATMTYRQPTLLLHNLAGQHFVDVSAAWLSPTAHRPLVGRGLAVGDFDNDGRMDALVVDSEGAPLLLHNEMPAAQCGHWLGITLRQAGRNQFAYGAQVTIEAGGKSYLHQCQPGGSYLSSSDLRIHAGVGEAAQISRVIVRWPDGVCEDWGPFPTDHYVILRRGQGKHR